MSTFQGLPTALFEFFADPASDRARKFLDIFSFEGAKL